MSAFWVTFNNRGAGCVEAKDSEAAMEKAKEFGEPKEAQRLPYPANPRLGEGTDCPSFCHRPYECCGSSCCPNRISCVD